MTWIDSLRPGSEWGALCEPKLSSRLLTGRYQCLDVDYWDTINDDSAATPLQMVDSGETSITRQLHYTFWVSECAIWAIIQNIVHLHCHRGQWSGCWVYHSSNNLAHYTRITGPFAQLHYPRRQNYWVCHLSDNTKPWYIYIIIGGSDQVAECINLVTIWHIMHVLE
jgi:hypothetical protein